MLFVGLTVVDIQNVGFHCDSIVWKEKENIEMAAKMTVNVISSQLTSTSESF